MTVDGGPGNNLGSINYPRSSACRSASWRCRCRKEAADDAVASEKAANDAAASKKAADDAAAAKKAAERKFELLQHVDFSGW